MGDGVRGLPGPEREMGHAAARRGRQKSHFTAIGRDHVGLGAKWPGDKTVHCRRHALYTPLSA
jgi:hypothetical protein